LFSTFGLDTRIPVSPDGQEHYCLLSKQTYIDGYHQYGSADSSSTRKKKEELFYNYPSRQKESLI
jgi:hypothetical protein